MKERKLYESKELEKVKMRDKHKFSELTRSMELQRKEVETSNAINKTKQDFETNLRNVRKEQALASELERLKREEIRELRMR